MSSDITARHILVLGAGGYIGSRLCKRLVTEPRFAHSRFTFSDRHLDVGVSDSRVRWVEGDIGDQATRAALLTDPVQVVFHLAGILGGAAEADYPLSRRVNIDGTLSLFESLRSSEHPPRVVFTSSVAVYGPPLPDYIDDDTIPLPTMTYGAQKRMMEIALEQFSARGWLDGLALRLSGIVARPDANPNMKASFLNQIFYAVAGGTDFDVPVRADGTTWLISVPACIDALIHAATLEPGKLGKRRALTLPTQCVRMGDLVAALRRQFPASRSVVRFQPDAQLDAQFASLPPISTALGDSLGFRHDGSIDALVRRAFEDGGL